MKAGNGRSEAFHHDVTRGECRKLHHDTTRREYSLLPDGFKAQRLQPGRGRDRNREDAFGYTSTPRKEREAKGRGKTWEPRERFTDPRLQPWGIGSVPYSGADRIHRLQPRGLPARPARERSEPGRRYQRSPSSRNASAIFSFCSSVRCFGVVMCSRMYRSPVPAMEA